MRKVQMRDGAEACKAEERGGSEAHAGVGALMRTPPHTHTHSQLSLRSASSCSNPVHSAFFKPH